MIIKKGTKLKVSHCRKGKFIGEAAEDFDTETKEFFPIIHLEGEIYKVAGFGSLSSYDYGESVPCKNSFCEIEVL